MSLTIQRPGIPVPLPLTRGGTEATTPAGARAKLELGDLALLTAPGGTTQFLRADKVWAVPPGAGGGGAGTFLELTDAPDTYTGQGGLSVRVNAGATALEFAALPVASETAPGLVELATTAEVQAGTDTTRAVTPATLAAKLPLTTKGDLLVQGASVLTRLPVGTDGQVLTADAALALGVKWATPTGGGTNYWSRVDLGGSTLATGLLAFWPMEEATGNRLDSVSSQALIPTGTAVQVSNAAGKIGQALAMNGTAGTYLSIADNATFSAAPNMSLTVACWVYVAGTGANMGFLGKGSAAVSSNQVEYLLWLFGGAWCFMVGSGSSFVNLASLTAPVANTWTLLVGWYDHVADLQYIQVNNGTPTQVANTAGSYDSTLPFEVGRTVGHSTQSLTGRLDMPCFWKRVLTPAERTALWNNGNGLAYPFLLPSQLAPLTTSDQLVLAASAMTTERLELDAANGAIKLGNAVGTVDGTMRWTGTNFEGRKAGAWASLTGPPLPLAIADGGTGATTAPAARTALGLGTLATQDASAVAITDGRMSIGGHAPTGVLDVQSGVVASDVANFYPGVRVWPVAPSGATVVQPLRVESMTGAASTTSSFYGLVVSNQPVGSYVYGVDLEIASGTDRYNIYAGGTALNYFGGHLLVAPGKTLLLGTANHLPSFGACTEVVYGSVAGIGFRPTSDAGHYACYFTNAASANVGSITTTATATAFNTTSDVRLKHAIATLTGALERVQALRPVSFRWQADDSAGVGFLAHELQRTIPEAVTGEPDAVHDDGSIRPQGVDHSRLVPWLTAALQETMAQLDALTARIATLEEALGL